jgi:hypothetical protein
MYREIYLGLRPSAQGAFQKHIFSIPNSDLGQSIEDVHIIVVAWVFHTNP